jgi:predicted Zn-dependent protease
MVVCAETPRVFGAHGFHRRAARRLDPKENRPMTVRWKPLMILSGLFLAVALVGVVAITLTLVPRSSRAILGRARTARQANRFEDAEIYYKQALQLEARSAAIHEEFAGMYRGWSRVAPAAKQASLRAERLDHLVSAVKFDKAHQSARQELLKDAMTLDLVPESIYWAKELLKVDPDDADAHYVLAVDALDERTPNVPEARRHLKVLEERQAPLLRRLWIRAKLADATGDTAARTAAMNQAGNSGSVAELGAVDRLAWLRIVALAIRAQTDKGQVAPPRRQVQFMLVLAKELCKAEDVAPPRVARIRLVLEQTQRALFEQSAKLAGTDKQAIDALVDSIDVELESIFKLALFGEAEPDLQTYLSYADHLRFRRQREKCLQVIEQALESPQAARRTSVHAVMGLHTVAVEMALAQADDKGRFDKAAPHIRVLLESPEPRFQGLGHLFAGSIDLDLSGMARDMVEDGAQPKPETRSQPKLRYSALNHLKIAATLLPEIAEAQARYGVALVLSGEQNLGRQFLQTALRLGSLDAQYQLWAAWTVLQAGYPEEAEPIIKSLLQQETSGGIPRELTGAIHLLSGELHQARRAPGDLEKAVAEFDKALAAGQETSATVVVRLAQIDVQLGRHDRALARIDALRAQGKGSPTVEQLAVLTLEEQGKKSDARSRLRAARTAYPRSPELAGLDAALLAKDGRPADADRVLEVFLKDHLDSVTLVMMRAQIQAEALKNDEAARSLLKGVADRTESSAPLVQLAGLELERNRLDDAAAVIARIRARWKEAATSDVLEAQLALKRGHVGEAVEHFDAALKKDPDNKIVQYWKAQLDGQNGAVAEATKSLEAIVRDKPVKELDPGKSLMSAAQSALANLSLRTGALDDAIARFEELKRGDQNGTLSKADRWQLITAYVARGGWPAAKREIAALLNDQKNPPTDDERVRGANFYRQQGEDAAAQAQLDYVLEVDPTNAAAVVTRSYILLKAKQHAQAAAILRRGIQLAEQKEKAPAVFYLMLAAVENESAPTATALARALGVLETGLERSPDSVELVQAKYAALRADGQTAAAVALVEAKAKAFPKGPFRRELFTVYRDLGRFEQAAALVRELLAESPDDTNLAAALVQVVSLEAAEAGARNQVDRERELSDKAAAMIAEYRARYKNSVVFIQAECDMAARRGDFARAIELTREIDKSSKTTPVGALLRARIYAALGRTRELAQAYSEALERDPRQLELRVLLGQARLKLGEAEEALRQAKLVLDVEKNQPSAALLQASALAALDTEQSRTAAITGLEALLKAYPQFNDAARTLAEVHLKSKDRGAAVLVLKQALKANPNDTVAAARLIDILAQRIEGGQPPAAADLAKAKRIAGEIAAGDAKGHMIRAVAIGFQRARQLELAYPYAEAAAKQLDTPAAHLGFGDLLLSIAEGQPDDAQARAAFSRAVEQYDIVLKSQPKSVEAVNNKAWILHTYLGQSQRALELVLELQKGVSTAALPGEFYDTLGAIQESVGQVGNAEKSYLDGLKKAPAHPVLNYHFGKMIAADRSRAGTARSHLKRALAARERLSPSMTQDAIRLVQQLERDGAVR